MIEKEKKEKDINIFETHIIPEDYMDDEADDNLSFQPMDLVQPYEMPRLSPTNKALNTQGTQDQEYINNEFSLDLPHIIPEVKEPTTLTHQDELMRWHLCLNQLPFKRICKMAKEGLLPKQLLMAQQPICPACQYGKMHYKPGRDDESR